MTILRPVSDVLTDGWTARPNAPYYSKVNESVADQSTYCSAPLSGVQPLRFAVSGPVPTGTHSVRFGLYVTTGTASVRAAAYDDEGARVGVSDWAEVTASPSAINFVLVTDAPATQIQIEGGFEIVTGQVSLGQDPISLNGSAVGWVPAGLVMFDPIGLGDEPLWLNGELVGYEQ